MTVVISGSDISSTAAFTAGGSLMTTVTFSISDDSVSLEDDEEYFLNMHNPNPSTRVIVGDRTKIIIKDDDGMLCCIYLVNAITIILFLQHWYMVLLIHSEDLLKMEEMVHLILSSPELLSQLHIT